MCIRDRYSSLYCSYSSLYFSCSSLLSFSGRGVPSVRKRLASQALQYPYRSTAGFNHGCIRNSSVPTMDLKPPPQLVRRGEGSNKNKATSPHSPCMLIGSCAVILFPRIATILSAQRGVYPGQDPLASGQGASSDPILSLRDRWQS